MDFVFFIQAFLGSLSFIVLSYVCYRVTNLPSMIDFFWAVGITTTSVILILVNGAMGLNKWVYLICIGLWGARLAIYFAMTRLMTKHYDHRYGQLIKKNNHQSFIFQHVLQCILQVLMVCTSYQLIGDAVGYSIGLILGCLVFLIGLFGQAIADIQLNRFKRASPGICDVGLWGRCRHPNYFFEVVIWVGLFLIGTDTLDLSFAISFIGPLSIFIITYYITGPYSESCSIQKRGNVYRSYQKRVPFFFPMLFK